MKKVLSIALTAIAFSASVSAADAYQTKEQVFEEWLILNTCMEHAKTESAKDENLDTGALVLDCVNEAKLNQK